MKIAISTLLLPPARSTRRGPTRTQKVVKRQAQYQYIADEAPNDPVKAAQDIQTIPGVPNANSPVQTDALIVQGDGNTANPPGLEQVPFVATPTATDLAQQLGITDGDTAWQALPDLEGFTLNRTFVAYQGLIMPFYITNNYQPGADNSAIKRVIMTMPGKPRDAWNYANLFRNALSVAANNPANGVNPAEVAILAPAWMNQNDKSAGAVGPNELYFHGSQWQRGGNSRNENVKPGISTYAVMDNLTDWLFLSGEFPNLHQVVVGGHSMGGQATHRYALLKKRKSYDPNMQYWVGNPGSWAWIDGERPYANASCGGVDVWPYGLGNYSAIPRYARYDVKDGHDEVVQRYLGRKVHYALGLLDTGAGDTHCEALTQGGSHLDRGSQFVMMLGRQAGGFPSSHSLDVIEGTSHQDYPMIRADKSVARIFVADYNTSYPSLTDTSNPGDKTEKTKATKLPNGKKAFATPAHEKAAWSLLGGSLALVAIFFTVLPWMFRANLDKYESQGWETESKRKLL
ncbi:uncharacterized protein PFL1_03537 [Pseudozyma flocculosa PF-1]|uniref:Uncharacterized protein n=1 Tax=Pseudozyma flocculosa PF-1 TaxID=1277687 RepID=A0A061H7W0_9BASI|nr:uncharacterized protein PFL1_03537 [Pseudozyma flocculosa PF-1]EPQ28733.1 hypothetical protein PFL1_03537 [Pseudozyma flocculosa PF-1]